MAWGGGTIGFFDLNICYLTSKKFLNCYNNLTKIACDFINVRYENFKLALLKICILHVYRRACESASLSDH